MIYSYYESLVNFFVCSIRREILPKILMKY